MVKRPSNLGSVGGRLVRELAALLEEEGRQVSRTKPPTAKPVVFVAADKSSAVSASGTAAKNQGAKSAKDNKAVGSSAEADTTHASQAAPAVPRMPKLLRASFAGGAEWTGSDAVALTVVELELDAVEVVNEVECAELSQRLQALLVRAQTGFGGSPAELAVLIFRIRFCQLLLRLASADHEPSDIYARELFQTPEELYADLTDEGDFSLELRRPHCLHWCVIDICVWIYTVCNTGGA